MPRKILTEEEKIQKRKLRAEQKEAQRLEAVDKMERNRVLEKYLNEPNIYYQLGQNIKYGNHEIAIVTEILRDGKAYKLHVKGLSNHYGKDVPYERDCYVAWCDIHPQSDETPEQLHEESHIFLQYFQTHISGLILQFYDFGIDTEPDYQRGNVWSLDDKVKLIDSIFNDLDIGKFVLISRPYKEKQKHYEILDGKQRLLALIDFYEGRFPYKGKIFRELHWRDKNHFENYSVSTAEVTKLSQKDRYRLFLRLNQGGRAVEQSHIERVKELYNKCTDDKSVWS